MSELQNVDPRFLNAHSKDPHQVLGELQVDSQKGLSAELRKVRLHHYGPNLLPKSEGDTAFRIFLRQFQNPLVYVLLVSSGLALLMGKGVDALVVLGVVLINSIIGFIQEFRAGKALEALSAMVPQIATIVEDSRIREVQGADLVPGDIVLLKSGDKVAADLRLIETKSLRIEEAALTGESVAAEKDSQAVAEDAGLGDRTGMAFSGTLVVYGTARGVVVGTGSQTELGKISKLLSSTTQIDTPLTQSLARFGSAVSWGVVVVALLLLVVGYLRGFGLADALLAAVTLAVAAIPEGLPAIVTITLAIGVRRMADRRAVIRKLPAVETLGSATIICSDKTGTLTRNEMTVTALWTPSGSFGMTGDGYRPQGQLVRDGVPVTTPPILCGHC